VSERRPRASGADRHEAARDERDRSASDRNGRDGAGADALDGRPVLDPAVVDSLRRLGTRSGRDVLAELTTMFLATADSQVRAAADLLDRRDLAELARVAHALKGSSSVIGARRVAASALALEDSCGLTTRGIGSASVAAARAALARFVEELEHYRAAVADLGIDTAGPAPEDRAGPAPGD
jgi:HPt (histidine-containing phosphotransfer) domain-containing protein